MQNRHPADRLADVRSEIKRLEAEEAKLRAYLLEHPHDRIGEEHIAVIGSQSRNPIQNCVSAGALRSIAIVGQIEAISSELRMYARTKHRDRTAVSVVSALLRFLVAWAPGSCYSALLPMNRCSRPIIRLRAAGRSSRRAVAI